jgi:hypothetical protein
MVFEIFSLSCAKVQYFRGKIVLVIFITPGDDVFFLLKICTCSFGLKYTVHSVNAVKAHIIGVNKKGTKEVGMRLVPGRGPFYPKVVFQTVPWEYNFEPELKPDS